MPTATGTATTTACSSFEVNTDIVEDVPPDWADLLKPEYAEQPSRSPAIRAPRTRRSRRVYAAGLAAGADAGRPRPGGRAQVLRRAEQGRQLRAGDRQGRDAGAGRDADRHLLGLQRAGRRATRSHGNPPVEVVVPKTGVVAGVYVQAISAYAPHPNAAKLWMEYLYSDEGQLGWLKGYCHPIRFNDLAASGMIPQELLDKLPPAAAYEAAVFPTLEEQDARTADDQGQLGQRRRRRPCPN